MKTSVKIGKGVENLFGTFDENLKLLERCLRVSTHLQDETLEIEGESSNVARARRLVEEYADLVEQGARFDQGEVQSFIRILCEDPDATLKGLTEAGRPRTFGKKVIAPKSANQRRYVNAIETHDMVFGIGPSGTGKTYLAVAMAAAALAGQAARRAAPPPSPSPPYPPGSSHTHLSMMNRCRHISRMCEPGSSSTTTMTQRGIRKTYCVNVVPSGNSTSARLTRI